MTTVAIMQPYFMPYAGYFRLFAAADLFVIYDCVQFPRRGWVHRNRLPNANREPSWLTLPLESAPRETRICDLRFAPDAEQRLARQLRKFPVLSGPGVSDSPPARDLLPQTREIPVAYLERTLISVCDALGLPFQMQRSSSMAVDPDARGSDRILAILEQLGATQYVNLSGGRALYSHSIFARHGIRLSFLEDYAGPSWSILYRLLREDAADIAADIREQCRYA